MFAIKVNKVLSAFVQPMILTCVNTMHRHLHNLKKVKKSFPQQYCLIILWDHSNAIVILMPVKCQITFLSTVMELETQCVNKLSILSLNNLTRSFKKSTAFSIVLRVLITLQKLPWSSWTSESDKDFSNNRQIKTDKLSLTIHPKVLMLIKALLNSQKLSMVSSTFSWFHIQ